MRRVVLAVLNAVAGVLFFVTLVVFYLAHALEKKRRGVPAREHWR